MRWTIERTNPIHYVIRFLVFMIASLLVVALIVAGCSQGKSSENNGSEPNKSWDQFETGRFMNEIIDLAPSQGCRIFMRTTPACFRCIADCLTGDGLVGTDTTA